MSEPATKSATGVTPGKLALIGVLAVILVVVLVVQFGGFGDSDGAPTPPTVRPTAKTPSAAPQTPIAPPSASTPADATAETSDWPSFTAEEARRYDPFAVPAAMAPWLGPETVATDDTGVPLDEMQQRRAAQLEETLNMLRTHGVSLILDDGTGPVAAIGDRTFRVGDAIGGFRVVDINPHQGVVLEAIQQKE